MAVAGKREYNEEYGIKGYEINGEIRFNFLNKSIAHPLPKGKLNRYLDEIMKRSERLPSPD